MKIFFIFFIFLNIIFYTNIQLAKELLIYADSIDYDSQNNIIAKGNAKIISNVDVDNLLAFIINSQW